MVWQFSTVCTTICCDVSYPLAIYHLPFWTTILKSTVPTILKSTVVTNRDVPNYTMTSSAHNGAMCHVKGIGTTGVNPGFKLVLNPD